MKRKLYNTKRSHPAERSLSIFPLLRKTKAYSISETSQQKSTPDSCYLPSSPSCKGKNVKDFSKRVRICFDCSPVLPDTMVKKYKENSNISSCCRAADEDFIQATKTKLEFTEKHLPKRSHSNENKLAFKLPRISVPNFSIGNLKGSTKPYAKDVLPTVSNEKWNQCRCTRKKGQTLQGQLDDIKLKDIARNFRPEETPHMVSIYVRWKTDRDGTSDYNYNSLVDTFKTFGTLSNIVLKSRNSAIVVFNNTKSACTAAKVFQKVGRELKLYVKWLKEIM